MCREQVSALQLQAKDQDIKKTLVAADEQRHTVQVCLLLGAIAI